MIDFPSVHSWYCATDACYVMVDYFTIPFKLKIGKFYSCLQQFGLKWNIGLDILSGPFKVEWFPNLFPFHWNRNQHQRSVILLSWLGFVFPLQKANGQIQDVVTLLLKHCLCLVIDVIQSFLKFLRGQIGSQFLVAFRKLWKVKGNMIPHRRLVLLLILFVGHKIHLVFLQDQCLEKICGRLIYYGEGFSSWLEVKKLVP